MTLIVHRDAEVNGISEEMKQNPALIEELERLLDTSTLEPVSEDEIQHPTLGELYEDFSGMPKPRSSKTYSERMKALERSFLLVPHPDVDELGFNRVLQRIEYEAYIGLNNKRSCAGIDDVSWLN